MLIPPEVGGSAVARARNGDRTALHALIERATPQVRRWARGRLRGTLGTTPTPRASE